MSKEEVMRKLEEIKKLYGGMGPIIDVTPQQVEKSLEQPEEITDASEAGNEVVPEAERQPTKLPYYPD